MMASEAIKGSWAIETVGGARAARAALVAAGTAMMILSAPTALIEKMTETVGLSTLIAAAAPPLGFTARVSLALGAAIPAAAMVWIFWGRAPVRLRLPATDKIREEEPMQIASAAPDAAPRIPMWSALLRVVRGGNGPAIDPALARRRADSHPDAPPRPPLMASRDLPPFAETEAEPAAEPVLAQADLPAEPAPMAVQPAVSGPALPRSPEPFTDEELAVAQFLPPVTQASFATVEEVITPADDEAMIPAEDPGLSDLLVRFESGLARRTAIADSVIANETLGERLTLQPQDETVRAALRALRPVEHVSAPIAEAPTQPAPEALIDRDVEDALESALSTLRRLTEQGRR